MPRDWRLFSKITLGTAEETLPAFPEGKSVPKIIHQVYFSRKLPPRIQENVEKIRALNPGWEYRFYDDGDMLDFISANYGKRVIACYSRINRKYGASRADLFRYLLMYKVGGIYLDIKSSLEKPLDQVLQKGDVFILSRWRNAAGERYEGWGVHGQLRSIGGQEFQQWHIIAAPGHPLLRAVIEAVLRNIDRYNPLLHDTGKNGVLRLTGPIAYTKSLTPLLHLHKHRFVDSEADLGLTYSIFGSPSMRAHKVIFKNHYTELSEPVADLAGAKKLLWLMFGPIQIHLIHPVRDTVDALSRRLPNSPKRG